MIKYKRLENRDINPHQLLGKSLLNVLHLLKNQPYKLANSVKKTKRIQTKTNNMNK